MLIVVDFLFLRLRSSRLVGRLLINRSSRRPHIEKLAAAKIHPSSGSRRVGAHYAASILQCVADSLNNQVRNCERGPALAPRSYPDDLRASVERNRSRLSDRKQQCPVELKTSVRLGTDRTQRNQEATGGVKPKRGRMADSWRRTSHTPRSRMRGRWHRGLCSRSWEIVVRRGSG